MEADMEARFQRGRPASSPPYPTQRLQAGERCRLARRGAQRVAFSVGEVLLWHLKQIAKPGRLKKMATDGSGGFSPVSGLPGRQLARLLWANWRPTALQQK